MNGNEAISKIEEQDRNSEQDCAPESAHSAAPDRRRVIGAGAAVLLALQAKTVLGQTACQSPSGQFSGNTSPRPGGPPPCELGRAPGAWVDPGLLSTAGITPPEFNGQFETRVVGVGTCVAPTLRSSGTLFTSIFASAPGEFSGKGVWEVLAYPDRFGVYGQLARHCIAGVLNARTVAGYPATELQVKDMWAGALGFGYCPLGTGCGSNLWGAAEIVSYLASTFDGSSEVQICRKG